jgi:hypothetical protein
MSDEGILIQLVLQQCFVLLRFVFQRISLQLATYLVTDQRSFSQLQRYEGIIKTRDGNKTAPNFSCNYDTKTETLTETSLCGT